LQFFEELEQDVALHLLWNFWASRSHVEKNCQKRVKIKREMDGQRWSSNVHKVINIQKNLGKKIW
jgi:hypothetical protein